MEERPQSDLGLGVQQNPPRPATLKRINMRRFLEEIRTRGPSTRAELTRATGVAPPTSSSTIADLLETGWLEQSDDDRATAKGRPGKVFRLASSSTAMVLGVRIDIDECVIAPSGLDGIPRDAEAKRFPTPKDYDGLLQAIFRHADAYLKPGKGRCLGLGLAVPGLVDEGSGRVAMSPNLHFLDGQPLCTDLQRRLEIEVVCTQEEHALCLAEQRLGRAKELSDYAVVDVSSGMGMGVVSGGSYIHGRRGFAGEIGHVTAEPNGQLCGCGNRGCMETVATDTALLNAVCARVGQRLSFEEMTNRIARGNLDIAPELDRTLDYVAIALSSVTNLFNPEAIFLHGRLLDLAPDTMDRLRVKTRARALGPSFEGVQLHRAQGNKLYGALAGLLDQVFAAVGPRLT
ncbi:ROK family transcriptional regulator [Fimbriimonas ginsengisoli]|uniref:Transcriptional repressor of the xylose operon n=1 Tax=Fimbriimonas ginsengisoli Gsoil 348 TaxID=661478 RepID=A0A068NM65_FIMGI|nr:ROK family transcriptional regulator [Fimbriimonas ginsengisoli]AIE84653.1 transcriptional repressor of the xylose operon [Fimbriimonas ginsengisoli Gsoil 348]